MVEFDSQGTRRGSSPTRRTRQACVNCRRKKSKCPGEKPQCSICRRLEQACTYESYDSQSRKRRRSDEGSQGVVLEEVSRRFGSMEQKLEELAASLQKPPTNSNNNIRTPEFNRNNTTGPVGSNRPTMTPATVEMEYRSSGQLPTQNISYRVYGSEELPKNVIEDGVETYFKYFHSQPYSLLRQEDITKIAWPCSNVVLIPMLALSVRASSHPFWKKSSELNRWINILTEKSWRDLLEMYAEENTSLEYLQGLCLLAQVDFADGRVKRAHSQISLGVRIAQASGYLTSTINESGTGSKDDIIRCTWTLFMLDRTFCTSRLVSPTLSYQSFQLPKPTSEDRHSAQQHSDAAPSPGNSIASSYQDLSSLITGVYSIWDDAIKYVFQTTSNNTVPPWHPNSDLATIEYRFADFEPEFSTHRYREVDFPRQAIHEPKLRPYFASWLCFQLTYMSIQCCIHHPFIMFTKLQHVIRNVPPSFLQKSYKSSLIHSRWIIRFLDEMEEAGMMLYDPFIGYLAAIAATIQLEHTLSKHADIAAAAHLSFRSAIRYLRKLSKYWTSIQTLLGIVEELAARLRHRHTLYYSQDDYDGILPAVETERVGLADDDATLMWKVFDYASMSATPSVAKRTIDTPPSTEVNTSQALPLGNGVIQRTENTMAQNFNVPNTMPVNSHSTQQAGNDISAPNLALFDQLPEDWAFTIDDWTLFGAPGSTYFYNEGV